MHMELSAHGMTVLRALNMAVEKTAVPIEGNLFYHHNSNITCETPPDPSRAHKRRNFLRAVNGSLLFVEIGFNAGHSALLALDRNPGLSYVGLDIAVHPWTRMCSAIMEAAFPGRCRFIFGDSLELLPKLVQTGELGIIDVCHVDGGHEDHVARSDVCHALKLVRPGGVVLVDDTRHPPIRAVVDDAVRMGKCAIESFRGSWEGDESVAIRTDPVRRPISIVYSAIGREHVLQAAISAWSAKRWMPDAVTVLVSDQAVESPYFDHTQQFIPSDADPGRAAKIAKIYAIRTAATEQILYVDNDTYFVADVTSIFDDRQSFDIAAVLDTWQFPEIYRNTNNGLPLRDPPASQPFFNSGVLFINKSKKLEEFLDRWMNPFIYNNSMKLEQMYFREAIYSAGLSVRVLPATFNARIGEPSLFSGEIHIAHCALGSSDKWETSVPFVTEFLNQHKFNRAWVPTEAKMFSMDMNAHVESQELASFSSIKEEPRYLDPDVSFVP